MHYDVHTPSEYLEALVDDWRKPKLLQLRQMILDRSDEIAEGIQYKMLHFYNDANSLCHLTAQKNYVSLYIGDTRHVDPDGTLLKGINCGKGCIRFKKSDDLTSPNIQTLLDRMIDLWQQGTDLSC